MASLDFLNYIKQFNATTFVQSNVKKLYDLLFPHMALDFRGLEDCKQAMIIVDLHTHNYIGAGMYSSPQITPAPIQKSAVNEGLTAAKIGIDPQTKLPARISTSIVLKPFKVI
jgi:hypothetical protein